MKKRKLAVFILALATMVSSMPVQAAEVAGDFQSVAATTEVGDPENITDESTDAEDEKTENDILETEESDSEAPKDAADESEDAEEETVESEVSEAVTEEAATDETATDETATDETATDETETSENTLPVSEDAMDDVLPVGAEFTVDKIKYRVTSHEHFEVEAYATDSLIPLKTLTIPSVVEYNNVFYGVTSIPSGGFSDAFLATKIVISSGIENIDAMAFPGLDKVQEISLPSSLQTFTTMGFPNLETITVGEHSEYFKTVDGVLFTADGSKLWLYPSGDARTSYTVPEGTEVIGECSFYQNKHLNTLTLADSVTEIEPYAFYEVQALTDITLRENISYVGEYNFYKCPALKKVTLNNSGFLGGTYNGDIISQCPALETIVIDGALNGYGPFVFYELPSLKSYEVRNSNYYRSVDGVLFGGTQLLRYPAAKDNTTYRVPEDTTKIAGLAFNHMKNTTEVILNPGVSLNVMAFQYPNTNAPLDIYFSDKETVRLDTSNAGVFVGLNDGSHIYLPTDAALESFNSFQNAINSEEGVMVIVEKKAAPDQREYTVKFNSQGGSSVLEQDTVNGKLTSLPETVRDGYQFEGWYTALEGGEKVTTDTVFYANAEVYARWTEITEPTGKILSGITDGKTYCAAVTVTVSDAYLDNVAVTLNGKEVSLTDGRLVINPALDAQTVAAVSKSGRSESYTITVNEGHRWGKPEWVWSSDKTTASLSVTCQNDSSHVERPEVHMSKKEIPATCTAEGRITYTAKAEFEGQVYTYENSVPVPKKKHSMIYHEAVGATTGHAGNVEFWFCSECGLNYDSAEGTHVIADVTIPVKRENTATSEEHSASGAGNHATPATGDSRAVLLWGVLLILAGSGLTGSTYYRKKEK